MGDKTILIVDDTIINLDVLIDLLDEYDVVDTTNGKDAIEIANSEKIDLILLDIMMPVMDGYEVCKKLKNNPSTKDIPVIFITAKTDEDSIEKAYEVGGSDYVTKPFKPRELKARIKRELKLQDMQNELKLLSITDPLTKLYNRRYFSETAKHILDITKRENQELSLIMLDIDKFKLINDTFGHDVGDKVLIGLSKQLVKNHRKSDIVCRFGGEEFVILLPNTCLNSANMLADKIRKNVEELRLDINDNKVNFTISLGVSKVYNSSETNIEKALKRADDALYDAKNSGRNKVCIKL